MKAYRVVALFAGLLVGLLPYSRVEATTHGTASFCESGPDAAMSEGASVVRGINDVAWKTKENGDWPAAFEMIFKAQLCEKKLEESGIEINDLRNARIQAATAVTETGVGENDWRGVRIGLSILLHEMNLNPNIKTKYSIFNDINYFLNAQYSALTSKFKKPKNRKVKHALANLDDLGQLANIISYIGLNDDVKNVMGFRKKNEFIIYLRKIDDILFNSLSDNVDAGSVGVLSDDLIDQYAYLIFQVSQALVMFGDIQTTQMADDQAFRLLTIADRVDRASGDRNAGKGHNFRILATRIFELNRNYQKAGQTLRRVGIYALNGFSSRFIGANAARYVARTAGRITGLSGYHLRQLTIRLSPSTTAPMWATWFPLFVAEKPSSGQNPEWNRSGPTNLTRMIVAGRDTVLVVKPVGIGNDGFTLGVRNRTGGSGPGANDIKSYGRILSTDLAGNIGCVDANLEPARIFDNFKKRFDAGKAETEKKKPEWNLQSSSAVQSVQKLYFDDKLGWDWRVHGIYGVTVDAATAVLKIKSANPLALTLPNLRLLCGE